MESASGQLSEELRVLYVAVTRAKEKLIMTAAVKKALEAAFKYSPEGAVLQDYEAADCKSYAHWMFAALGCCGDVAEAMRIGETLGGIRLRLIEGQNTACETLDEEKDQQPPAEKENADPEMLSEATEAIKRQIEFQYPFAAATMMPAKLSVSELTHRKKDGYRFSLKPAFAAKAAAGSDRGTAVHAFMQYCDYAAAADNAESELAHLVSMGMLTEKQGELVDIGVINGFFESELYRRISSAQEVKREFAVMASAADCPSVREKYSRGEEATMLQGVADCLFIEDGKAVILDYKTDRVKDASALLERYSGQLTLYKEMVEAVLGIKTAECVIWSFALGCEIKVY